MTINVYICGDSGPSGFGVATRGLVKRLVGRDDININFRTHQWGWNREGYSLELGDMLFPDTRFREYLMRNDYVNEDYLLEDPREFGDRDDDLMQNLSTSDSEDLMIKQWEGEPEDADVWYAAGGVGFAYQAPSGPYTILHADYNLDIVPDLTFRQPLKQQFYNLLDSPYTPFHRQETLEELGLQHEKDLEEYILKNDTQSILHDFEELLANAGDDLMESMSGHEKEATDAFNPNPSQYQQFFEQLRFYVENMVNEESGWEPKLKNVHEVWVPSEWTRDAILRRYPELEDSVFAFPYGIEMDYKPGDYDHENCPEAHGVPKPVEQRAQEPCLADGSFNFLVISRIYHIKGLYRTLKAYIEEFTADENVRMYIKTTSNQQFDFDAEAMANNVVGEMQYPNAPEISLGTDAMDTQHLYDLMGHSDCFVQASRAECYGIAQLQAAWCGTPVIATNWSSQRELIGDADGFIMLDDYELEQPEPEADGVMFQHSDYYPIDSKWAVPDIDSLGFLMRRVYNMSEEERKWMGEQASEYVAENYDWDDMVEPRVERLHEVAEKRAEVMSDD